jgi:hypothetical protein
MIHPYTCVYSMQIYLGEIPHHTGKLVLFSATISKEFITVHYMSQA